MRPRVQVSHVNRFPIGQKRVRHNEQLLQIFLIAIEKASLSIEEKLIKEANVAAQFK